MDENVSDLDKKPTIIDLTGPNKITHNASSPSSQIKFTDPIHVNFLDVSTPLKLNNHAQLKYLSTFVGVDKNLDYVADSLLGTERLCLDKVLKSDRSMKVHTLSHYESGLNLELHDFARPHITKSYLLHMPSSGMPYD